MNMRTVAELSKYVEEKLQGEYTYNTHIEAIADITLAAFELAADKLGASGYSASCAELLFLQKSRNIQGPFIVLKGQDMLYPQYWDRIPEHLKAEWMPWARKEAQKLLDSQTEEDLKFASDSVINHWKNLAYGEL